MGKKEGKRVRESTRDRESKRLSEQEIERGRERRGDGGIHKALYDFALFFSLLIKQADSSPP